MSQFYSAGLFEPAIPDSALYHYPIGSRSNTTIEDTLQNADATAQGTTNSTGDWKEGYAEVGDGTDDYIEGPQEWHDWCDTNQNRWLTFTVDLPAGSQYIFGLFNQTSPSNYWIISDANSIGSVSASNGELLWRGQGDDGSAAEIVTDSAVLDGTKHRILWQRTGPSVSDIEIWVDGSEVPVTVTGSGTYNGQLAGTLIPYFLGLNNDGSPSSYSQGGIDNIIFGEFDQTLTASEIESDYNNQPWS